MIEDIDKDGSGTIDFDEFLSMMTAKVGDKDSREEKLKIFKLFVGEDSGKNGITFKRFMECAADLGETMTEDELQEMFDEGDTDGDGVVNEEEFFRILEKSK